jgi:DNA modification methylase
LRRKTYVAAFAAMADAPNVKTGDGDIIRERAVPIAERDHLAEKPEAVLTRLIGKTTPERGLVLDPFMGSGSTLRAARFLGRRAAGIDVEERYCGIAVERLGQGLLDLGEAA